MVESHDASGSDAATSISRAKPGDTVLVAVDRSENAIVVLVDDVGASVEIPASRLPSSCNREGAVLRVPIGPDSQPEWNRAQRDRAEEKRRLSVLSDRLDKLRKKDPGGDVSL